MKKITLSYILFFLTSISAFSQISEDFEGISLPDVLGNWALISGDWKVFDNGLGTNASWTASTAGFALNGIGRAADVQRAFNGQGITSEDWLVMPRKTMRPNEQLRFFTRQGIIGDSGTLYQIRVSTNIDPLNQAAYTLYQQYTEAELINAGGDYNVYNEKVIDMTQTGQQLYIAFVKVHTQVGSGVSGDRWLIDNVQLALRCVEPTNLSAEQITCNTAKIKFSNPANATLFNVEYGLYPFAQGTSSFPIFQTTSGSVNNPTNLISGLNPGTDYAYYIQSECGPGRTSAWVGPYFFKTLELGALCSCPKPIATLPYSDLSNTNVYGDNLTQNSPGSAASCGISGNYLGGQDAVYAYTPSTNENITVTMNPYSATNTGIFVYDNCSNIGTTCFAGVANTNSTIRTISNLGLVGGTTYYFVISSTAATFSFPYLLTIQPFTCPSPTTLSATPMMTNALLSWANPAGQTYTNWEYVVQPYGDGIPTTPGTPSSTNTNVDTSPAYPLTAGTAYQYWVRADCGSGTFSPWSGPYPFNTTQCLAADQCNYTFTLNDSAGDGWENGKVIIRQNGFDIATLGTTFTTGGTQNNVIPLCDDLPLELFWSDGGANPAEIGISVKNSFNQIIYTLPFNSQTQVGTILYNDLVECDYPLCQAVTGTLGTNTITEYGANLTWNTPVWATTLGFNYDVYISAAPFTAPANGTTITPDNITTFLVQNVTSPYTIPQSLGLQQDTQYRYWVRINCTNNGPSPWTTNSGVFTTLPKCPRFTSLQVGTMVVNTVAIPPNVDVPVYWTTPPTPPNSISAWVIALPLTNPATPTPTFTPGAPWIQVPAGFGTLASQFIIPGLVPDTAYNYYAVNDCMPLNGYSNVVGPRGFTTPPSCPKPNPFNVTFPSITTTSATFTWTNGTPTDTQWEILLVPSMTLTPPTALPPANPTFPGQILQTINAPSPYTNNALTPATIYFAYLRTVCSSTNKSSWTPVRVFNTKACEDADKCDYRVYLTNSDPTINSWNGGRVQIRQNGIIISTLGAAQINGQPVIVKVCPGVPVDVYWSVAGTTPNNIGLVFANSYFDVLYEKLPGDGTPLTVLYQSVGNCTPIGCQKPIPTTVDVTTITSTSAILTWAEQASSTQWEVFVAPLGTNPPVNGTPVVGTTTGTVVGNGTYYLVNGTSTLTVNGLLPQTTYQFYVRAICTPTDFSGWTILTPINFVTRPINDDCDGAIMVGVSPNRICSTLISGNTLGATASLPVTAPLCPGTTNDDVWFSFVATSTTHIITFSNVVGGANNINHALYQGTDCNALTQLYCSNPDISIASNLVIGNTYKIRVYTNGNSTTQPATFDLCITTPATVTNDDCLTATVAVVNNGLVCNETTPGSLAGASASTQGGTTCAGVEDDDVWFSFVANSAQQIIDILNVQGTNTDVNHAVYSGDCTSLTLLYCSDPNNSTANGLTIGQTYYIRVWSASNTIQDITFDLCIGRILPPITSNITQYTTQQLIEDVFLNTTCANVTNITTSTGINFPPITARGIGYFNGLGSDFPFADGIVLSTGNATSVPGPNSSLLGEGGEDFAFPPTWTGDADLEAIILAGTGQVMDSHNASILEFDFTPLSEQISFNYIFASEEYGTFQCNFSDSFAFILTDIATGIATNLAVLPNSTTPVSVVTIRDEAYNPGACNSVNPEYFAAFYGNNGVNPLGAPINFNGVTVPLTASATVVPGNQYHIKLVIADRGDSVYDSAVFLEGDSFNIGNVELGNDFLESNGNAICPGDTVVINSNLDPAVYNFTWSLNGDVIADETEETLIVHEAGVYSVVAQYGVSSCIQTDSVTVQYIVDDIAGTPQNLADCDSSGSSIFDLTVNEPALLAPFVLGTHTAVFFTSFVDADSNNLANAITNSDAYPNISNPQTIYVRVNKLGSSCYQVLSFELSVQDAPPQFTLSGATEICPNESTVISVVPTDNDFDINLVTYQWQLNGLDLPTETNSTITISGLNIGTYSCTVNNLGCVNTQSVEITNSNTAWNLATTGTTSLCPSETGSIVSSVSNNPTGATETYTYLLPDGSTSTETSNTLAVSQTGTYTVTVDILGCTSSITYNISPSSTVWNLATTGTTSLCPSETGSIVSSVSNNPTGATETYTYLLPDGITSTETSNTLAVSQTGTYTVTVDILGCTSSITYNISPSSTVWNLATTGTTSLCPSETGSIVSSVSNNPTGATEIYTYLLPDGNTSTETTNTLAVSQTGTYTVTVDILGCTSSITYTISPSSTVWNIATTGTTSLCPSETGSIVSSVSNNPTGVTEIYTYLLPDGSTSTETSNTLAVSQTGTYMVTVDILGCTSSITYNISPSSTVWNLATTGTTSLCPSETGSIVSSVSNNPTGATEIYTYLLPDGNTSTETTNTLAVSQTGTYTVTVDILGCTSSITYTISPSSTVWNIATTGTTSLCPSETGSIVSSVSNNPTGATETYTYLLPDGSTSATTSNVLSINQIGQYTITVDILGCTNSITYNVTSSDVNEFGFDYESGCQGSQYVIRVFSSDNSFDVANSTFVWTNPSGQVISNEATCVANVSGNYSCLVTNQQGCSSVFSQSFLNTSCSIQKGISPRGTNGGDGLNDYFDLQGLNVTKLEILNRYGKKVYSKNNYTKEWYGQSDAGEELPDGTYFYVIELKDEAAKTGWIYINREK